jgi:hypothetical protein
MNNDKKKRGRKPKGSIMMTKMENNSEDEIIISNLPILIEEDDFTSDNIFIKSENNHVLELKKEIDSLKKTLNKFKVNNTSSVLKMDYNKKDNVKCWWCRNSFITPRVSLPEQYCDDKFLTNGIFCSYNCAKSYNLNLNDFNVQKRNNLLNLFYYKTYGEFKEILPAPSWKVLKEYGGCLDIDKFRDNFVLNTTEYLYLEPPLTSHKPIIEENSRKSELFLSMQKEMENQNELVLKRSKPIKSKLENLEDLMGLKKYNKKTTDSYTDI